MFLLSYLRQWRKFLRSDRVIIRINTCLNNVYPRLRTRKSLRFEKISVSFDFRCVDRDMDHEPVWLLQISLVWGFRTRCRLLKQLGCSKSFWRRQEPLKFCLIALTLSWGTPVICWRQARSWTLSWWLFPNNTIRTLKKRSFENEVSRKNARTGP